MNSRSSLSSGGDCARRLCAMFMLVGGCDWLENGSAPSSNSGEERSSSGEGDMRSRDRASASSSSEAVEESEGEMMRAVAGLLPAFVGIG